MKNKSLAKNSLYYLAYRLLNVFFPLATSIYVARILLPESTGKVATAQNLAQYFVILSFLGLPTYGLREISKARDNQKELDRLYSEFMIINFFSTIFFLAVYLIIVFAFPRFYDRLGLYLIAGGAIAFNFFNNSWLYEGLEEFRYISIRNISVKILFFIALIILVRNPADYLIYAGIVVVGNGLNYIINILYARKFVTFTFEGLRFKRHIKPIVLLVIVNLAIELYSLVDVTMLGALSADDNVAYYTYATKTLSIFKQIINTFTIVVVPRLAYYYSENKKDELNRILTKTVEVIVVLSCFFIALLYVISRNAIVFLYGDLFIASANVLKIMSVVLIISPIGYILGSRILLITSNEKKMAICVGIGAVVNIVGNYFLIPIFNEIGAAIASIISESVVMVAYLSLGKRYYSLDFKLTEIIKIIIAIIAMLVVSICVGRIIKGLFVSLLAQSVLAGVVYFLLLYVMGETTTKEYVGKIIKRVRK